MFLLNFRGLLLRFAQSIISKPYQRARWLVPGGQEQSSKDLAGRLLRLKNRLRADDDGDAFAFFDLLEHL
jgi:hypothetical protein